MTDRPPVAPLPSATPPGLSGFPPWVPALLVFALLTAGLFGVRAAVEHATRARVERETQMLAEQVVFRLRQCVDTRLALVDSLRREFQASTTDAPDLAIFSGRAAILVEQFAGYQAINWVDTDGRIALVTPLEPNRGALGKQVDQHPSAGPYFLEAKSSGQPTVTTPLDLFQGGRGFASYYPVHGANGTLGYVNGVFRLDTLVESCFPGGLLRTHALRITDGSDELFTSPGWAEAAAQSHYSVLPLPVSRRTWTVQVAPDSAIVTGRLGEGGLALLLLGLALCSATGALVFQVAQREQRLTASRHRMHTLLSLLPDLVVRFTRNGELIDVQGQRGPFSSGADPGDRLDKLLPGPLAQAALDRFQHNSESPTTHQLEDADGNSNSWELRVVQTGQQTALAVLRDVSDRAKAQLQHTLLSSLVEASDLLIALNDPAGRVTYLNPFGRTLLGLSPDQPVGSIQVLDMVLPDDLHIAVGALTSVQQTGSWNGEGRLAPKAGPDGVRVQIPVDMRLFSVLHPDTRAPIAVAVIARDLRQTRELEAELVRSQRMEAIGRLAGGVAHDFNNVMTAILGHTEIARMSPGLPPEVIEELDGAQRSAERAGRLTRQLLAFSSRQLTQTHALPLNALVQDMQGMLQRLIPSHIQITLRLSPALGLVQADEAQLEQVVLNLVANAADAMPDGGHITLRTRNDGISHVILHVDDQGQGVPEHLRDHIFEPFVSSKSAGTGLGLATVHRIVTQSGGDVTLLPLPSGGTRFTVRLPRSTAPASTQAPRPTLDPIPSLPPERNRVLFVDDEPSILEVMTTWLRSQGLNVTGAADGLSAAELIDAGGQWDLLVTDYMMPGMTGLALAAKLRESCPSATIILASGYTDGRVNPDHLSSLQAGWLAKPYTPRALLARVTAALVQE